jgi:hypothetical protein
MSWVKKAHEHEWRNTLSELVDLFLETMVGPFSTYETGTPVKDKSTDIYIKLRDISGATKAQDILPVIPEIKTMFDEMSKMDGFYGEQREALPKIIKLLDDMAEYAEIELQ